MSRTETTGTREIILSEWHRSSSIGRYFDDPEIAKSMYCLDIDHMHFCEVNGRRTTLLFCEYFKFTSEPDAKEWMHLQDLGKHRTLPCECYQVAYKPSTQINPRAKFKSRDIEMFAVRQIHPTLTRKWTYMTPRAYAHFLHNARQRVETQIRKHLESKPKAHAPARNGYVQLVLGQEFLHRSHNQAIL